MALLPVQIITRDDGLEILFTPVDTAAGDTFENDGQVFLVFQNAFGLFNVAEIVTPAKVDELVVANRDLFIDRKTLSVWGPFLTHVYNDPLGIMTVIYPSGAHSLEIAVVRRQG